MILFDANAAARAVQSNATARPCGASVWRRHRNTAKCTVAARPPRAPWRCCVLVATVAVANLPWSPTACGAAAFAQTRASAAQTYRIEATSQTKSPIEQRFSRSQIQILEMLNRADLRHLKRLTVLVVPTTWTADELAYSPLPKRYAWAAQHAKALVVHQPSQVFGGYERGQLVRWGPVSTGREDLATPSGLFYLTWRSRVRRSTDNSDWLMPWYFNFQNTRGLSFHQYTLPGYPASHACIRLLQRDARWLYEWGESWNVAPRGWPVLEQGTPVLIVGSYDFDQPPPWQSPNWWQTKIALPENPPPGDTVVSGPGSADGLGAAVWFPAGGPARSLTAFYGGPPTTMKYMGDSGMPSSACSRCE
jgi:lipoprotein-anchoring transpeptidase ErfK/SrfK